MPISYEVTLRDLRFHACVGVLAHERELSQPIAVDLTVWRTAESTAELERAPLDYRTLEAIVQRVMAGAPIDYLETIAARIAEGALATAGVSRARVVVRKPHVALGVPLAGAEVALDIGRDG